MKFQINVFFSVFILHSTLYGLDDVFEIAIYPPSGLDYARVCTLQTLTQTQVLPTIILTREDFTAPLATSQAWHLTPRRWDRQKAFDQLHDHCFIVYTRHHSPIAGVILSSYTARMIKTSVIFVHHSPQGIVLHLCNVKE